MQDSIKPLAPVAVVFLLLLAVLWWGFDHHLDRQANPNQDLVTAPGNREPVVLEAGSGGHYRAPGTINASPVVFLVDTGATVVAVSDTLADRLGLRRGPRVRVETAGGSRTAYMTRLQRVVVGSIVVNNVRAAIVDGMSDDYALLGMSFLSHVNIRQKDGQLVLDQ